MIRAQASIDGFTHNLCCAPLTPTLSPVGRGNPPEPAASSESNLGAVTAGPQATVCLLIGFLLLIWFGATGACSQDSDFYRGRTMTIIIPIGPGGAYDAYARLVSRHLGKQLPSNPT